MSALGPLRSFGGYRDVLKSVLTSVDLPRPDSPASGQLSSCKSEPSWTRRCVPRRNSPTTITLKLKPFRTLLRCHWLGRLAKPTYPVNFRRTMFLLSAACWAAILGFVDETVCAGVGACPCCWKYCCSSAAFRSAGDAAAPFGVAGVCGVRKPPGGPGVLMPGTGPRPLEAKSIECQ